MKIYVIHNLDGVNQAMVVAPTLKAAAARLHTTVYDIRQHGWHVADEDDRKESESRAHNEVLFKPIDHFPPHTYWRRERWTTKEVRAAARARSLIVSRGYERRRG